MAITNYYTRNRLQHFDAFAYIMYVISYSNLMFTLLIKVKFRFCGLSSNYQMLCSLDKHYEMHTYVCTCITMRPMLTLSRIGNQWKKKKILRYLVVWKSQGWCRVGLASSSVCWATNFHFTHGISIINRGDRSGGGITWHSWVMSQPDLAKSCFLLFFFSLKSIGFGKKILFVSTKYL